MSNDVIKFVKQLQKVSHNSDCWLRVYGGSIVPVELKNGDVPVLTESFSNEVSAMLDQASLDECIIFNENKEFRLTYKGLHIDKWIRSERIKFFRDSIIIPIVVAFLTTLLLQLTGWLSNLPALIQ